MESGPKALRTTDFNPVIAYARRTLVLVSPLYGLSSGIMPSLLPQLPTEDAFCPNFAILVRIAMCKLHQEMALIGTVR
jgi:hypothetical protein